MTARLGQTVHYRSHGTPGGQYKPECRAAIVTAVLPISPTGQLRRSVAVLNPTGILFDPDCGYWSPEYQPGCLPGGTFHLLAECEQ